MNYLAHLVVLPERATRLTRVATALPDLWSRLPTPHLPLVICRALDAVDTDEARAVVLGARAHLRADATFHRHPEFERRVTALSAALATLAPGLEHLELAAHVLVEMLLDRHLLMRDGTLLAAFAEPFDATTIRATAALGARDAEGRGALERWLSGLASSGFLADYAAPASFVERYVRALARTGLVPAERLAPAALTANLEAWSRALAAGSEPLLDDVAASVHALF